MALVIKPPLSIMVDTKGLTHVLQGADIPLDSRHRIYVIHFASIKGDWELTLLENGLTRWQGLVKDKLSIRLDFGNRGWALEENADLDVIANGKKGKFSINVLQYLIENVRDTHG